MKVSAIDRAIIVCIKEAVERADTKELLDMGLTWKQIRTIRRLSPSNLTVVHGGRAPFRLLKKLVVDDCELIRLLKEQDDELSKADLAEKLVGLGGSYRMVNQLLAVSRQRFQTLRKVGRKTRPVGSDAFAAIENERMERDVLSACRDYEMLRDGDVSHPGVRVASLLHFVSTRMALDVNDVYRVYQRALRHGKVPADRRAN